MAATASSTAGIESMAATSRPRPTRMRRGGAKAANARTADPSNPPQILAHVPKRSGWLSTIAGTTAKKTFEAASSPSE